METGLEIAMGVIVILLIGVQIARRSVARKSSLLPDQPRSNASFGVRDNRRQGTEKGEKINTLGTYHEEPALSLQESEQLQPGEEVYLEEILTLLREGRKINAIKVYRQATGAGLKEAKEAVELLESKMDTLPSSGYKAISAISESGRDVREHLVDQTELQSLLREGRKIQAIKYYREKTGVGLKEAKEAVERLEPEMTSQRSGYMTTSDIYESAGVEERANLVDPEELQRLVRAGKKIEAIKYYRQATGVGLKEAKEAVDWLAEHMSS